jgi:hypothetical protein
MAGLSLRVGGFGGVGTAGDKSYGTPESYDSVTAKAFGPGASLPKADVKTAYHPTRPVGAAMWTGVAAVALLVMIRRSLPA